MVLTPDDDFQVRLPQPPSSSNGGAIQIFFQKLHACGSSLLSSFPVGSSDAPTQITSDIVFPASQHVF